MNNFGFLLLISLGIYLVIMVSFVIIKKTDLKNHFNIIFITGSLLTVYIHYLEALACLITKTPYVFTPNMYLPVYPCNAIMWLNVFMIPFLFKKGKAFTILATISFFIGTMCGFIGLTFNENFLRTPDLHDISILKGLLSHGMMIFTCLSLFVLNKLKINTIKNVLHSLFGFLYFIICYFISNIVLGIKGLDRVDYYYISTSMENVPFINFYTISIIGLILLIVITLIYEKVKYKEEDRSIYYLKVRFKKNV